MQMDQSRQKYKSSIFAQSTVTPSINVQKYNKSSLREHPVFAALVSPGENFGGEKRQPEIRLLTQATTREDDPDHLLLHTTITCTGVHILAK